MCERPTDNLFFYMPDFENYHAYHVYREFWNRWVDSAMALDQTSNIERDEDFLDCLGLAHLATLLRIQRGQPFDPLDLAVPDSSDKGDGGVRWERCKNELAAAWKELAENTNWSRGEPDPDRPLARSVS